MLEHQGTTKVRLDKWLWAARFFKTRALATEAISGGRVHVNGERAKPSRTVNLDDELRISKGEFQFVIRVCGLADKRGPASVAQTLYREDEASVVARQDKVEQRRLLHASAPQSDGRPNKKQRRQIHRFRNINDPD